MSTSRNDACPCGSGKKYKKCCLGAPDPREARRSKILGYGALALTIVTLAAVFLIGEGVGAAVGLGSFVLLIGYTLGSSAPASSKSPGKPKSGGRSKGAGTPGASAPPL